MELISEFQKLLKEKQMDAYLIPTSDDHQSEYICDFFKTRAYMTGFSGSAGTLLITQTEALLWVDGRYHIQAAKQTDGKPITLMKQGLPNVLTLEEYLKKNAEQISVLGLDGKVCSAQFVLDLAKALPSVQLKTNEDLFETFWKERPKLPMKMLFGLDLFFTGQSAQEKISIVQRNIKLNHCTAHVLTSLEDQAWLYNLRGKDIAYTPVFLSFTVVLENECHLFIDERKIDKTIEKYLKDINVQTHSYDSFYEFIKTLKNQTILVSFSKINYTIYDTLMKENQLENKENPTYLMKAVKNETEIKNTLLAHIKDGVAVTKWIHYIKTHLSQKMTEFTASQLLEEYRKKQDGFIEPSFNTICAYQKNAAMMHYSATADKAATLEANGLLLVDSGGHYLEGTTDITRTIALGRVSPTIKRHYTAVLKSMIALSQAVFLRGVRGTNLDILARGPIWKLLLDYKCGTGHGVGNLLSVHEGPNGFRWQVVPERNDSAVFEEGMITTNEPGIYLENKYGIRIENEMLCIHKGKNEYGDFLGFETITYVPIDLECIDTKLLDASEKKWLNEYHQTVYETISPYLTETEKMWLEACTKKIK